MGWIDGNSDSNPLAIDSALRIRIRKGFGDLTIKAIVHGSPYFLRYENHNYESVIDRSRRIKL